MTCLIIIFNMPVSSFTSMTDWIQKEKKIQAIQGEIPSGGLYGTQCDYPALMRHDFNYFFFEFLVVVKLDLFVLFIWGIHLIMIFVSFMGVTGITWVRVIVDLPCRSDWHGRGEPEPWPSFGLGSMRSGCNDYSLSACTVEGCGWLANGYVWCN